MVTEYSIYSQHNNQYFAAIIILWEVISQRKFFQKMWTLSSVIFVATLLLSKIAVYL